MAGLANDRPLAVSVSLRSIIALAGAAFLLKILHVVALITKHILRKQFPPRSLGQPYHNAEQRVLLTLRAIVESTRDDDPVFRKKRVFAWPGKALMAESPDGFAPFMESSASAFRTQGSAGESTPSLASMTAVPDNFDSDLGEASRIEEDDDNDASDVNGSIGLFSARASSTLRHAEIVSDYTPVSSSVTREVFTGDNSPSQENPGAIVSMDNLKRTESSATYPSKFPVSDHLDYGSLATAPMSLRDPNRKVRPQSDG